jgi:hypothetical protein
MNEPRWMGEEWHRQQRLQSALNEALNEAVRAFLDEHPETAWPTTRDAITDTKYDALGLWHATRDAARVAAEAEQ